MTRLRPALMGLLDICLFALLATSGAAERSAGPFYFAPSPTHECDGVPNCSARIGPWVAIPAHGEATFLLGCPSLSGYLVGGTDARASSGEVRVWFDGDLGAPIGRTGREGALLLFHAVTDNGQPGSFQPILGCVALEQKNKVSTLAFLRSTAIPGTAPSAPLDLHVRLVVIRPFRAGYAQRNGRAARCSQGERLVGSWYAIGFETASPPSDAELASITASLNIHEVAVKAVVRRLRTSSIPVAAVLQYGAMCEQ